MDEESIRREVWEGRIPVCFSVAVEEVGINLRGETAVPEPCYMLIPRISYFPLVYDRLEKLYARALQASAEDEIWLSSETMPLKWHYPVGVLYDLYGRRGRPPWNITVHCKRFPEESILHSHGKAVETHFRSKIKEADCLKHRSEIIQSLTPQEFGQLWEGFRQGNFVDFWTVNKKLMLNARSEHVSFRSIPFCIYQEGQLVFQRLVSPVRTSENEEGDPSEVVLEDLLKLYRSQHQLPTDHCVLVHGVELPTRTPLQWLSEHFSYPDNFLHISIVPRSP